MNRFFAENGFSTLQILHNNCYEYGDYALCGTRGWFYEETGDQKVFKRELIRLEASLKAAGERPKLCFLHYPPLYQGYSCPEIIALLEQYGVERCYYGHLHGQPPPGGGGGAGRRGVSPGLRGLCGLPPAKNLRIIEKKYGNFGAYLLL